jgi:phage/plasmid-associated DNA primase
MLNTRDIDFGFLRRICFINFPIQFVKQPKRSNERLVDLSMTAKLLKELPGILNWSLQGLAVLRENGGFTGTSDQETLLQELTLINDPVAAFVNDVILPSAAIWNSPHTRQDVYAAYNRWCNETNSMAMSSRWFWPKLRQHVTIRELRHGSGRSVVIGMKE